MKDTQIKFVKDQLETRGFITRNECLRNYISRLSSIILRLKDSGYLIKGERVPCGDKKYDYKYTLLKR